MRLIRRKRRVHILLPQRWHLFLQRMRGSKAMRALFTASLVLLAFFVTILWIDNHLRPIVTQLARVRVDYLASSAINNAIIEKLAADNVEYGKLVYFEKDIYGNITALKTDMVAINRLKADIINAVLTSIEDIGSSELSIPLGNLINGEMLSGRGPKIPVKIVPIGTVTASFANVFASAGINQTRHQIMMDICVDIGVLLPGYSVNTSVTAQVSIAETIIVGAVPDSYTHFEDSGQIFSDVAPYKDYMP